jgi:hypothetical protein
MMSFKSLQGIIMEIANIQKTPFKRVWEMPVDAAPNIDKSSATQTIAQTEVNSNSSLKIPLSLLNNLSFSIYIPQ